jgi:hypothetical protein
MLFPLPFDEEFFAVPCFRLKSPVRASDLLALAQHLGRGPLFAYAKLPASDIETARRLLEIGFHRACVQVELRRSFEAPASVCAAAAAPAATIVERLPLSDADIQAHAAHFVTSRFRQDPLIPAGRANRLYAKWIENSLSGGKRVVHIGRNFCSFSDTSSMRSIDLLSVIDKRRGYATSLLDTLIDDARSSGLRQLHVVTEVENAAALDLYRRFSIEIKTFHNCFHLINSRITP